MNEARPEGFQRVSAALSALGHPHAPRWLEVPARTSQEAADALGVQVGQIAKSVIFRRRADDVAVLVVTNLILLPVLLSHVGVSPAAARRAWLAEQVSDACPPRALQTQLQRSLHAEAS